VNPENRFEMFGCGAAHDKNLSGKSEDTKTVFMATISLREHQGLLCVAYLQFHYIAPKFVDSILHNNTGTYNPIKRFLWVNKENTCHYRAMINLY